MPKSTSVKPRPDGEVSVGPSKENTKKTKWRTWHYKLGLRRLEIWAHPEDFAEIRHFARVKLETRGIADNAYANRDATHEQLRGRERRENQG